MANWHLVILKKPYLDAILDGRKGIESRFMKTRRTPFNQVQPGDGLFLKISSGPVCATAKVCNAEYFTDLTPAKISQIRQRYNNGILADEAYWQERADCRFGFLAWLDDVKRISPVWINKKDWRSWVVLRLGDDFGLLQKRELRPIHT